MGRSSEQLRDRAALRATRIMVVMRLLNKLIEEIQEDGLGDVDISTAARARPSSKKGRCEGEAPEGTSRAASACGFPPANASPARPINAAAERIDISAAPSGMELAAARWRGQGLAPLSSPSAPPPTDSEAWCKCGGRFNSARGGPVPAWFGAKCIEENCPLKGKLA